jgi:hypothetical protein
MTKDSKTLEVRVGQKVLLFYETVWRGRSRKLSPQYIGPYEVLAVEGVNKRGRAAQKGHINRIRPFYGMEASVGSTRDEKEGGRM